MAAVNELVTKFAFVGSLKPQQTFNANLNQSIGLLAKTSTAIAAASAGFIAWASSVTASIDPMIQLSRETGVAIEKIQALGFAASVSGSSAGALESTVANLSKKIGDASRGMGAANQAFNRLGIQVRNTNGSLKSADQVLDDVRRSVQRLNIPLAEQRSLLGQMGIDQSLVQMLNQTDEEINTLIGRAQRLGVVTKDQADQAASYNDSLTTLRFGLRAVQTQMAVGLAPTMQSVADGFVTLLEKNSEFISKGLQVAGEVLIGFSQAMKRLLPVFALVGLAMVALKIKAIGFGAAMAIAFSPVTIITGVIVGLMLVIDDLIVAFKGGESVIADFFMSFFGIDIVPILHGIVDTFLWMVDAVLAVMKPILDFFTETLGGVVKIFTGDFKGGITQIAGAFTDLGKIIVDSMGEAFKWIVGQFSGVTDAIYEQFASLGRSITGMFTNVGAMIKQALVSATTNILPDWALRILGVSPDAPDSGVPVQPQNLPVQPSFLPQDVPVPVIQNMSDGSRQVITNNQSEVNNFNSLAPQAQTSFSPQDAVRMGIGGTTNNNSNVNQDVEINIQTNDPVRAGVAVEDALQRQLETAQTQSRRRGGR